jgi:hypothetical protein
MNKLPLGPHTPAPDEIVQAEARPGFVGYDAHGRFVHYCHCGRWGDFGFGYFPRQGKLGTWFCKEHRPTDPRAPR